jgi:exodeoxyribonuclease-3
VRLATWNVKLAEGPPAGYRAVSVYVPNGRAVGSPTFDEKLAFLDAAALRVAALRMAALRPDSGPLVVGGGFDVAPSHLDVYDPAPAVRRG